MKLLYNLLKPWFLKRYHNEQFPGVESATMEKAFVDGNGKVYYKYVNPFDMPLDRFRKQQEYLIELQAGLSGEELKLFMDAMTKAMGSDGKKPDLPMIGFCITEMRERGRMLIHPDILFKMVASMYIREDQDGTVWDEKIEQEKVKQLRKDSQGGLYGFFYSAGIQKYLPYLEKLEENWTEHMESAEVKLKALNELLTSYSTK